MATRLQIALGIGFMVACAATAWIIESDGLSNLGAKQSAPLVDSSSSQLGETQRMYSKEELAVHLKDKSKREVIELLGKPDSTRGSSYQETFNYELWGSAPRDWGVTDQSASGRYSGGVDVTFENDAVESVTF